MAIIAVSLEEGERRGEGADRKGRETDGRTDSGMGREREREREREGGREGVR